jgi:hypothetical protein
MQIHVRPTSQYKKRKHKHSSENSRKTPRFVSESPEPLKTEFLHHAWRTLPNAREKIKRTAHAHGNFYRWHF